MIMYKMCIVFLLALCSVGLAEKGCGKTYSKKFPCSDYELLEDCPKKEREAYEKIRTSKQFEQEEVYEDEAYYSQNRHWDCEDSDYYNMRNEKRYFKESWVSLTVSPQCESYMSDRDRLLMCEVSLTNGMFRHGKHVKPRFDSRGQAAFNQRKQQKQQRYFDDARPCRKEWTSEEERMSKYNARMKMKKSEKSYY